MMRLREWLKHCDDGKDLGCMMKGKCEITIYLLNLSSNKTGYFSAFFPLLFHNHIVSALLFLVIKIYCKCRRRGQRKFTQTLDLELQRKVLMDVPRDFKVIQIIHPSSLSRIDVMIMTEMYISCSSRQQREEERCVQKVLKAGGHIEALTN